MKISIFLLSLMCSVYSYTNNLCTSAVTLTPTGLICDGPTTTINFGPITPSSSPVNSCTALAVPDFWLHLNVPLGSTNSYMIRRRAGTDILARAEVLYKNACAPSGSCCQSGMTPIGCYNFESFPNAIILQNPVPGDYYIRVWDALLDTKGTFVASAHILPLDINDWIICDDISGEGSGFRANQWIIQPGQAFDASLYDPGFKIVDSCLCADPPLLLFQSDDFNIFLDGKITAQNDPDVEGSGYNYKMEDTRLHYAAGCVGPVICDPINKYLPSNTVAISRLAVIDAGINTKHEAFEEAHWKNDDPKNPEACVQVADIGYDFKHNQITPEDSLGHGSWVAGTVTEDFPTDIQLELMSLKFYSGDDNFLFDAVCAIYYAIDQGAATIVTSWGFTSSEYPDILSDALSESARENVLLVASAGNLGNDNDDPIIGKYPANAALDNIISVTAFDESAGNVPLYANYGASTVDLAAQDHVIAPGSALSGTTLDIRDSVVGTSISAPRVARTAAIMQAYYPILTAQDIRSCILDSVQQVSELVGVVATGGTLDHQAALKCALSKATAKACVQKPITVPGTLINDLTFSTSSYIEAFATIEASATVIFEAGLQIHLQSGFEVKNGAEFEANGNGCTSSPGAEH